MSRLSTSFWILTIGLIYSGGAVIAQTEVHGRVVDAGTRPIPYCNVFLEREGLLSRLTSTDDVGRFTLQPRDTGVYLMVATSIGYKKYKELIHVGLMPVEVIITLFPDTVLLSEVIVQSENPIQTRGDTLVYDATYFAQGDEVVLADLLKKLPGISVDDNGKVKFQGRNVSKIKIEDDDLFDRNYQILSKNLSADLVEQVEVLQHYTDNPLLKNLEDSDDVALNLTLKKDGKGKWFGDTRVESNLQDRYDGRLNVISLTRKIKLYGLTSANSVGDPATDSDGAPAPPTSRIGNDAESLYLVPIPKPAIPEFSRQRYFFNKSLFGSLNGVYKPTKKLKVTLAGYVLQDNTVFRSESSALYYSPTDTTEFRETALASTNEWHGLATAGVDLEVSPVTHISYKSNLQVHSASTGKSADLNLNDVSESLSSETIRQDQLLTVTHRMSEQTALSLDLRHATDARPQDYVVEGNLVAGYFSGQATSGSLGQSSNVPTRYGGGELNLFHRLQGGKLGFKAGYDFLMQSVNSRLISLAELSNNTLESRQHKSYAGVYYAWQTPHFSVTPGLTVEHLDVGLSDRLTQPIVFVNPRLGVRWQLSKQSKLLALYSFRQHTSAPVKLTTGPVLTGYNVISVNDSSFRTFAAQSFLVTYYFGNWTSGFNFFINALHNELPADYLTDADIEPNYVATTTNRVANRSLSSVSLTVDKFFRFAKTNLKVIWNYNRTAFVTSTESVSVPGTANGHHVDISLRTAFPGHWNVHAGHELRTSAAASSLSIAENYRSALYVDAYFNGFNRRLMVSVHSERCELMSVENRPVFYFLDVQARYSINATGRLTLLLKGKNLLDETVFRQRQVNPFSVVTETNPLIPRYIMAGLELRL